MTKYLFKPCGGYLSKALSIVLTLALATTMCVWPSAGTTQAYAESTATAPSLSTYAGNQALTDTTFAPNTEGTPSYVGKINFGKGADGKAASWYLLGGNGKNVDVLAAVSLANGEAFQEKGLDGGMTEAGFTPDTTAWENVTYLNGDKPSKVWWNNYGASDARVTLEKLATNVDKFSSVEQAMMNKTTVKTTDAMNKAADGSTNLVYETTDTLYLAATGKDVSQTNPYYPPLSNVPINVNGKTLNLAYYQGDYFYWLRTANPFTSIQDLNMVFCAIPWSDTDEGYEYGVWALGANIQAEARAQMRPATNLNLSSVLFASAAPITSTDTERTNIADDTAMNLRFEATDSTTVTKDEIGSGFFTRDYIYVTKGSDKTITLFAQGNDGTNDWYYASSLDGCSKGGSAILRASALGTDVDLTKCKVWLETTDSDGMTYAVNIFESCDVTFYIDGVAQTSQAQAVNKGGTATDPSSNFTKEGYTLDGWYINEDCTGSKFDFSTEITGDTKLYAKWVQYPFTVTFDSDGGSAVAEPTVKVEAYKTVAKPATDPTREGFTFKYWALDGEEFDFATPITKDITLKAVWDAVTPDPDPDPEVRELKRLAGNDADETAAAISQEGFESSKYAIVARWDDFADAMSASGLAGTLDCPILLTRLDALSEATAKELERLGAETVYVIGGTGAISEQIDKDLDAIASVKTHERIWGEYSWDTSLECANAITEHNGNPNSEAIVAVSFNFQDALSISSYAYKYKVPLLLEDNSYGVAGTLTDSAVSFVNDTEGTIWVAGGFVAVGRETVEGVFTNRDVTRLWGWDGYDTSNQIATYMTENNLLSASVVGIANGGQKAHGVDALAGAALIGKQGGVMLLSNSNEDMEAVNLVTIDAGKDSNGAASYLAANSEGVQNAYVLGGTVVAPETFFAKVQGILGIKG